MCHRCSCGKVVSDEAKYPICEECLQQKEVTRIQGSMDMRGNPIEANTCYYCGEAIPETDVICTRCSENEFGGAY